MNANILRGKIAEHRLTLEKVARVLDVSPNTLHRRMESGIWKNDEIMVLAKLLSLTEMDVLEIFFDEFVTKMDTAR